MPSYRPAILIFADLLGAWFGAALFNVVILMPATVQAGTSGVGFLRALARRHGIGALYAAFAFVTVITSIWMYLASGARDIWPALSIGLAILALLLGTSVNRAAESKWVNMAKNVPESAAADWAHEVEAVLAKTIRRNIATTIVLGIARICLVMGRMPN